MSAPSAKPVAPPLRQPAWVFLLGLGGLAAAGALFLLPVKGLKFWTFDYLLFLAAMLALPALLLHRRGRLLRGLVLVAALALWGFLQKACPREVGAIELVILNALGGKPLLAHALKVGVLLGVTLLFSRHFCGWICPKGIVQEFVYRPSLGVTVPGRLDRALKLGKYLMLAVLVLAPLVFGYRFFRELEPFKVIFNLDGTKTTVIILAVVLGASVFVERAFCRYLCPIGGLLGLLARLSPLKMRIREDQCTGCGACARVCPTAAIDAVPKQGAKINAAECIACLECQDACCKGGMRFGPARFRGAPADPQPRDRADDAACS